VVILAIRGEVTPGEIFTKCGTWADDVITCAIFDDCCCVGAVRKVI